MKNTYRICLINAQNQMVAYRILASTLASAVAAAQSKAGVAATVDPQSTQNEGAIDIEAN